MIFFGTGLPSGNLFFSATPARNSGVVQGMLIPGIIWCTRTLRNANLCAIFTKGPFSITI